MKAFITGASGFIGTHLVEELLRQKWQVRVLLHKRSLPDQERIQVFRGDISNSLPLKDMLRGTDVLFHLAAALGASQISKNEFIQINAQGTKNILEAAQEADVKRIIHFGSGGVLGSVKENKAVGEDYPVHPIDVYDRTKLEGERAALSFAKKGMNVVVVRPGWAYGPGDKRTFKLIKAVAKKRFILVTKGNTRLTPVYIQDLIDGVLLCAEKSKRGEIFHLAGPEVLTVKDTTNIIAEAVGVKIPRFSLPLLPVKVAAWSLEKAFSLFKREAPLSVGKLGFFIHPKPLSSQKAMKELGYSPKTDFRGGMQNAISWYRDHGWLS
ncbi:MAG: NAD-dependent epimerase/dehydratase family protein [Candidatus Aminicenantes bacterium]|nr:MAG: NAD-dependent epimerase/dehydratase family protein [Candidatus Aminicenantes bacterium]